MEVYECFCRLGWVTSNISTKLSTGIVEKNLMNKRLIWSQKCHLCVKIDRSFVTDIEQQSDGAAIAKMIISLGKALHMEVLAEGVETEAELACLESLGCYQYQGYLFSRPIPFDNFLDLLT